MWKMTARLIPSWLIGLLSLKDLSQIEIEVVQVIGICLFHNSLYLPVFTEHAGRTHDLLECPGNSLSIGGERLFRK
jgi:hypothetical protein